MTNANYPAGSPAASSLFRWEVADKAIAVHLSLELIERLERDTIEAFKNVTRRGSEIGGVLLGRLANAGKRLVLVDGFEPVECDHARGPLYVFAEADRKRLEQAIARAKSGGANVVGFFRSNTRRDLCLDDEDIALMKDFFPDAASIALIAKPFAMKPSAAAMFVWHNGQIDGTAPAEPFPFRRSEIEKSFANLIVKLDDPSLEALSGKRAPAPPPAQPAPKPPEKPAPPPPAPPFARREERAATAQPKEPPKPPVAPPPVRKEERPTVSPLAFRREERPAITPLTKPEQRPTGPVLVKKEEPAPEEKPAPPAQQVPKREDKPAIAPVHVRGGAVPATVLAKQPVKEEPAPAASAAPATKAERVTPTPPRAEPAPPPAAAQERTAPLPEVHAEARRSVFASRWLWIGVIVLVLAAGGAYKFVYMGQQTQQQQQADALDLKVERSAGQLLLSWNRGAPAIQAASRAMLTINDGDHREDVELELGQLRNGNIVYSPMTNDVSFRLEVTDMKGGKSVSESMRVLAGRPSPAIPVEQTPQTPQRLTPAPAATETQTASAATKPAETSPAKPAEQAAATPPPAPSEPSVTATPAVTLQPPKPESLAARLSAPAQMIDLPQISTSGNTAIPASNLPGVALPRVPPPSAAPPPERPAQAIGGNVVAAQLIRRAPINYPALARQARITGTVRVEATIGTDGRVKSARAISGPPLLRPAAVDSVRQWVYTPALLNGKPAETTTQVDLLFTGGR